ncbi:MAG: SBBP repeat-containing protein [Actinomycetota bacterium]|nr:SBBP repeat-containing protein [Actinomycetota bacterium]
MNRVVGAAGVRTPLVAHPRRDRRVRRRSARPTVGLLGALCVLGVAAVMVSSVGTHAGVVGHTSSPRAGTEAIKREFAALPLRFQRNLGQTDARVKFFSQQPGSTLFLTGSGTVLSVVTHGAGATATRGVRSAVVRTRLIGASRDPRVEGVGRLAGSSNYLIGDRSKWRQRVPGYSAVRYDHAYPGIDLVYSGRQGRLEYDFEVAAGANPRVIALALTGAKSLKIDRGGNLIVATAAGTVVQRRPVAFQRIGGAIHKVAAGFVLEGRDRVRFQIGSYDRSKALVIDPVLSYATPLGGTGTDAATAIATDSAGNAYVTGSTSSTDFPTQNPLQPAPGGASDVFVTKLGAAGSALVYSTYLGGSNVESGNAIAVDSSGNAYVTGSTNSTNFPTQNPLYPALKGSTNAFVTEINAAGSALVYSTYLGGGGSDTGRGIAVDSSGDAYVTGDTTSSGATPFPTTTGAFQTTSGGTEDAWVTELGAGGSSRLYSTYLGGAGIDSGRGIAVASGKVYVAGFTASSPFPTTTGAFQTTSGSGIDAFVTELNPAGSGASDLVYSTYLGGSGTDYGTGIAISSGNLFVTGGTSSSNFPTKGAIQATLAGEFDGYVTKLTPAGGGASDLVYSTYLGGPSFDQGNAIATDSAGDAYVGGETQSDTFPTTDPVESRGSNSDGFLAKLNPAGNALTYSTIIGGGEADRVFGVAVDSSGSALVAGNLFFTNDFPTVNPVQVLIDSKSQDAFVAKVASGNATGPLVTKLYPRSGPAGTSVAISGHGFSGATSVNFGGTPATSFTVNSDTSIAAVSPAQTASNAPVTVTGASGTSPSNPVNTYRYAEGIWGYTGNLPGPRFMSTMTLLQNGKVLVAGGRVSQEGPAIASAELYDPKTGTWSGAGSMATARFAATATLLENGKVLVAGGLLSSATSSNSGPISGLTLPVSPVAATASAELYDPATNSWSPAGSLVTARGQHTATLLEGPACSGASRPSYCGQVLIVGGRGVGRVPAFAQSELYDPASNSFTNTAGALATGRYDHTATLLQNGQVLAAGGLVANTVPSPATLNTATTEVYSPSTGLWSAGGALGEIRSRAGAVLLTGTGCGAICGKVLIAGGIGITGTQALLTAELYDPATGTSSETGPLVNYHLPVAPVVLPSGKVLYASGLTGGPSADLYNPITQAWEPAGLLNSPRGFIGYDASISNDAVVLSSSPNQFAADPSVCGSNCGKVLMAPDTDDATAELYTPAPRVDGFNPTAGATGGGTSVSITGLGFTNNVRSVLFGSTPAASFTVGSYGQITAVSPAGTGSVTISVVNDGGKATSAGTFAYQAAGPGPGPGAGSAPVVTHYGMTNTVFAAAAGATSISGVAANAIDEVFTAVARALGAAPVPGVAAKAKAKKPKQGTTFRYTLSEAASARIVIAQLVPGRRKGGRCIAPTHKLRKAKKCTQVLTRGTLTRTSHAGVNHVAFSGRIGSKALKPGGYRATLTATAASHSSKPQSLSFKIVKG